MGFNPFKERFDFEGKNLIEASAGTGKTYSITAIYLRLILEKGLLPPDILAVTFTVDATQELKKRVRNVIKESYDFLLNENNRTLQDSTLKDYLNGLKQERKNKYLFLLRESLMLFDDAPIYTIHKFCKRLLSENPVESGVSIDMNFSSKEDEFIEEMVFYILRKWLYGQDKTVANFFCDDFLKTFAIKDIITKYISADKLEFEYKSVDLRSIKEQYNNLIEEIISIAKNEDITKNKDLKGLFLNAYQSDSYLSPNILKEIVKKSKQDNITHAYETFHNSLLSYITSNVLKLLKGAKRYVDMLKTERNELTFSDLIRLVFDAVSSERLKTCPFKALLIDEFQDTDFLQVYIFERLFKDKVSFYIGDAKQSIYGFRSADLSAYFYATENIRNRFNLNVCYRSTNGLISAFNKIFAQDGFFEDKRIKYGEVEPVESPKIRVITKDNSKDLNFYILKNVTKKEDVLPALTKKLKNLLSSVSIEENTGKTRGLKPQDICILVRKNSDAENIRDYLSRNGIKCTLATTKSVYDTNQAQEVLATLKAINNFTNVSYVKSALLSDIFHKTIEDVMEKEPTADYKQLLLHYKDYLNKKGIMACFLHIFNAENTKDYILKKPNGERIYTNYLHILELLQDKQKKEKLTIEQLIRYLQLKITNKSGSAEEEELRLESDENAVKISTIHKSKGLEFPVVFLLYFAGASKKNNRRALEFKFDDKNKRYIVTINQNNNKNDESEVSRLLYVALTRAMSKCYIFDYKRRGMATLNKLLYGDKSSLNDIVNFLNGNFSDIATVKTISKDNDRIPLKNAEEQKMELEFKPFKGEIKSAHLLTSYSSLAKNRDVSYEEELIVEPFAEEFIVNTPTLPPGAQTGNLIHRILEEIDFSIEDNVLKSTIIKSMPDFSKEAIDSAFNMIKNLLQRPFTVNSKEFALNKLSNDKRISEMKFFISMKNPNAFFNALSGIFKERGDSEFLERLKRIKSVNIKHYLIGFIDLVFEFDNRIHIVDWKTNHLGTSFKDYSQENLYTEIAANDYFLQFGIYQLAVYKYIKSLNSDLKPGEILYLFVRGFAPENGSGVFRYKFSEDELNELARCIE